MKALALRAAVMTSVAAASLGVLAAGPAHADTFLNLGDSSTTQRVGDGSVTVTLKGQTALLSPGMVALPTTRNAWVSGALSVKIDSSKPGGGSVQAGYAVGCQINVGTAAINLSGSANSGVGFSSTGTNPLTVSPTVSAKSGGSIKLAAGAVGLQYLTYDRAKWPKPGDDIAPDWFAPISDPKFTGAATSLSFQDQTIGVDGCAGYAQARFFARVKAKAGNTEVNVILWGKPFTLG